MIALHFSFAGISPSLVWAGFGVVWVLFPRCLSVLFASADFSTAVIAAVSWFISGLFRIYAGLFRVYAGL